jgi:hypothetical protein
VNLGSGGLDINWCDERPRPEIWLISVEKLVSGIAGFIAVRNELRISDRRCSQDWRVETRGAAAFLVFLT